jgi:hypothetical protein
MEDSIVRLLKRLLQRLMIFGLGIFSVWLIVFVVFETADRRLPWILALSITYGLPRILFSHAPFVWVSKSFNENGCPATQSQAMDCLVIPSMSHSWVRDNSSDRPLRSSVGQKQMDWV